jgi:hypothetical protein
MTTAKNQFTPVLPSAGLEGKLARVEGKMSRFLMGVKNRDKFPSRGKDVSEGNMARRESWLIIPPRNFFFPLATYRWAAGERF